MAIYKTARFRVRPDGLETAVQAIHEFIEYVRDNEPGTLRYTSWQSAEDAASFLHFFVFEDREAEELHASSPGVERFTGVLYPLVTAGGVEFADHELLASA